MDKIKNGLVISSDGTTKLWFKDDQLHKEDGPAVEITTDSTKLWYQYGEYHRDEIDPETGLSLPAIEYSSGTKEWYINGKCHRFDGPAIEYEDGDKEWFLDGKQTTEEEVMNRWEIIKEQNRLSEMIKDKPKKESFKL